MIRVVRIEWLASIPGRDYSVLVPNLARRAVTNEPNCTLNWEYGMRRHIDSHNWEAGVLVGWCAGVVKDEPESFEFSCDKDAGRRGVWAARQGPILVLVEHLFNKPPETMEAHGLDAGTYADREFAFPCRAYLRGHGSSG